MTELASKSRIAAAPQAHAPAVGLSGAGRQRAAIEALLSPRYRIVAVDDANLTDSAERCGVVLAVSDGWETDYGGIAKACGETETPWLPVRVELGQAVIGPLARPGQPGCASCAESRRRAARMDGTLRQPLHERYGRQLAEKASTWLTGLAVDTVAALVAGEVGALLDRDAATDPAAVARTRAALVCVALDTLATSVHPFL